MVIATLILLGLIFGSFTNALVWRFHEQAELLERQSRNKKQNAKVSSKGVHTAAKDFAGSQHSQSLSLRELSMVHGRSMCSNCHHELAAKDLVPLISWLWLRGKCRYCGIKIQDNPLVEVSTAQLFVISYLCWPLPLHSIGLLQFIVWLVFVVAFVALTVYDLRWFLLPNRIVFPLIWLAVGEILLVASLKHDVRFALDALAGVAVLAGLFYGLFQLSGGTWIGGGDVKLAVVLGLLAGSPPKALLLLFLSSVIGTMVSLPQLAKGRAGMRVKVPFGPFLLAATFLVVLFGNAIINWYNGLLIEP